MQKLLTISVLVLVLVPFSAELVSTPCTRKLSITKFYGSSLNPINREGGTDKRLKPCPLNHLRGGSDELDVKEPSAQSAQIESFRFDVDTKSRAIRQLQLDSCQRSMDACFQR